MTTTEDKMILDLGLFTDEHELNLLAHWSVGNNREDIGEIDSILFTRKKLYKAVLEGKNPTQIFNDGELEGATISELLILSSTDYGNADYREAKARALKKQIGIYAQKIGNCNGEDTSELYEKIKRSEALLNGEDFKPLATNYGEKFISWLEDREEENNPQYGKGFKWIDEYTDGIHRGQLTVIGARPRIGKSAIALQIAYNVAVSQGHKVLFLPLEMTVNECLNRILLQAQVVDPGYTKDCTEEEKQNIANYLEMLEENLKFCTALNKIEDIERVVKAEKPYLLIVDQLSQVNTSTKRKDLREKYVEITRAMKRIALEQNISIIALSQINRANSDNNRPGIESLAESDTIGQDADNVFLLYTKSDEEDTDSEERITYLHIGKQRNGKSGVEVPLMFRGERFTFSPIDYTYR